MCVPYIYQMRKVEEVYARRPTPGCVKEGYLFKKSSSKMLQVRSRSGHCCVAARVDYLYWILTYILAIPIPIGIPIPYFLDIHKCAYLAPVGKNLRNVEKTNVNRTCEKKNSNNVSLRYHGGFLPDVKC